MYCRSYKNKGDVKVKNKIGEINIGDGKKKVRNIFNFLQEYLNSLVATLLAVVHCVWLKPQKHTSI